jgi:hypothetical protein
MRLQHSQRLPSLPHQLALSNGAGFCEGIAGFGNTQPLTPPDAPSLLAPATSITFQWGASPGATKYQLQVNIAQAFTETSMFDVEIGTNTMQ